MMGFRKGLGIIIAGFALAGCAEYVAAELAVQASENQMTAGLRCFGHTDVAHLL